MLHRVLLMLPKAMNPPGDLFSEPQASGQASLDQRFAGKVALITGASDRGIGGSIAVRLAREGAAVALLSRRVPERLLKRVNRFDQGSVHTRGDVTKAADITRAIDDCMEEFGKIDALLRSDRVQRDLHADDDDTQD